MALDLCEVEMDAESAVIEAFRQEWGRVVAALIGLTGDWDLAEECAQDAFAKAAKRWPPLGRHNRPDEDGQPPNVRWVVLHMIEETACHSGHLDIAREMADGRTNLGDRL